MPWRRSATCSVRPSSTSPIRAMDTSGVALQLRAEAFNHYRCDGDLTMGLDLAELAKAFCCANNDDIITMEAEEGWFDLLVTFEFESPEYGEIKKKKFDFLDVNGVPIEIPESLESEAIVRMPSAKFMRICNQLSSVGDRGPSDTVVVSISVDKERVRFFTRGKAGYSTIVCRQTQTVDKPKEATLIEMKERKVSLIFGLRYMNSFSKASTLSDQVTIKLSSDLLMVFEYKIAEMGYIR
ncbi:hypothetical protein BRADI_4g45420v3 [Brachypodium distachyon]|uniref:DNA sliding clamp PCNA n=1 Tax=Brachypodium distachyon TaxID=15368 RepID=A0A0Q3PTA6_BRADI|nr:hypothetical protein BRADI_4g45420v3 [Brachypodium distachyon]